MLGKIKREITTEQIFEPARGEDKIRLVFIEGVPGIGKSTFCWELCRKWETISCMKKYQLVILLRLREKEVQKISNVSELFYSYGAEDKTRLVDEVSKSHGKGVLFILDGFDELPKALQKEGFLISLIQGRPLPECTVLVTSRPSATAELLTSVRPQKRVEILGFTQESVEKYASSVFSPQSETLERFKAYISASNNPAINSLMYIPLNAAVIVEVFRYHKPDHPLPHTLTKLYTQLCLTYLNRHLKSEFSSMNVCKFEDLPPDLYQHFLTLCEVAFEGIKNEKVIFHTLRPDLVHFGFLDAVSALYGGGQVSYNFLHLTVQEFFAAYHISQLSDDSGLEMLGDDARWNIVLRFVAGLTKFRFFDGKREYYRELFTRDMKGEYKGQSIMSLLCVQCILEAQIPVQHESIFHDKMPSLVWAPRLDSPLDAYALGYCISISPTRIPWKVSLYYGDVGPYFIAGLKNNSYNGAACIQELTFKYSSDLHIDADWKVLFVLDALVSLTFIHYNLSDSSLAHLVELIPLMINLQELHIFANLKEDNNNWIKVLNQLSLTNLRYLELGEFYADLTPNLYDDYCSALRRLIRPCTGKLEELFIHTKTCDDKLMRVLSSESSLKSLTLHLILSDGSDSFPITYFKHNTSLNALTMIEDDNWSASGHISEVIKFDTTLQHLKFGTLLNLDGLELIAQALHENTTLHEVTIIAGYDDDGSRITKPTFLTDPRIVWETL